MGTISLFGWCLEWYGPLLLVNFNGDVSICPFLQVVYNHVIIPSRDLKYQPLSYRWSIRTCLVGYKDVLRNLERLRIRGPS